MPASPVFRYGVVPFLLACVLVGAYFLATPAFADRLVLWRIVHEQCAPHAEAGQHPPKPCDEVELAGEGAGGMAFLKDLNGVAQMLAIPTARVTGIEDPKVLAPDAADYFAAAWRARRDLDAHLGRGTARDDVAITVNSEFSRSQDQLHLHVDCLDPKVGAAIEVYKPAIDSEWRPMTIALNGRKYWARRIDSDDLVGVSPFRLLSEGIAGAKERMGLWTLAAVPADFDGKPSFILLADHAELTEGGHAEDIQDHTCAGVPPKS